MKSVIVIVLLMVVGALVWAGVSMLRPRPGAAAEAPDRRMAWALTLRVGLSVALFLLVMLSWWLGWLTPHGV